MRAFDRDADGAIVRRWGGAQPEVYEQGAWTHAVGSPVQERATPELSLEGGSTAQYHLVDVGGTAVVTARSSGLVVGHRRPRAYGQPFIENGEPLRQQGFHTHREEPTLGLTAAGPRHLLLKDGRWLQPEPLLYLGPPIGNIRSPRSLLTYRYALNAPTAAVDWTGMDPLTSKAADDENTRAYEYTEQQGATLEEAASLVRSTEASGSPQEYGGGVYRHPTDADAPLYFGPPQTIGEAGKPGEDAGGAIGIKNKMEVEYGGGTVEFIRCGMYHIEPGQANADDGTPTSRADMIAVQSSRPEDLTPSYVFVTGHTTSSTRATAASLAPRTTVIINRAPGAIATVPPQMGLHGYATPQAFASDASNLNPSVIVYLGRNRLTPVE